MSGDGAPLAAARAVPGAPLFEDTQRLELENAAINVVAAFRADLDGGQLPPAKYSALLQLAVAVLPFEQAHADMAELLESGDLPPGPNGARIAHQAAAAEASPSA